MNQNGLRVRDGVCGSGLWLATSEYRQGLLSVAAMRGIGRRRRGLLIDCTIHELRLLVGGRIELLQLLVIHVVIKVIVDLLKTGTLATSGGRLDSTGKSLAGARGTGDRAVCLGGSDAVNGHLGGVLSLLCGLLLGLSQLLNGAKLPLNAIGS